MIPKQERINHSNYVMFILFVVLIIKLKKRRNKNKEKNWEWSKDFRVWRFQSSLIKKQREEKRKRRLTEVDMKGKQYLPFQQWPLLLMIDYNKQVCFWWLLLPQYLWILNLNILQLVQMCLVLEHRGFDTWRNITNYWCF